jgi:hypothetical protein
VECDCQTEGVANLTGGTGGADECHVCEPGVGSVPVLDLTPCGETGEQVCCGGACCAAGECCEYGQCVPCGCRIDGTAYEWYAPNPANACERCDPTLDRFAWSPQLSATCGPTGEQICCAGICCPDDQCCTLGVCGPCNCEIAGQEYTGGVTNPANRCQVCDPTRDRFAWSPLGDDLPCAFDAPRVCCGGACCAAGQCCDTASGTCGACAPTGCTIDGVYYPDYALNPQNECEHCDSFESTTSWSFNGFASCGPTGQQFCNGHGACCPLGICPDVTVPGFCGDFCDAVCVIDGVLYHTDDNDGADCLACLPSQSHTSWTVTC